MSVYTSKVKARFDSPRFAGRSSKENAVGTSASFECGSFARMSLAIRSDTGEIDEARFQTNGCGYMIAAADTIAQAMTGLRLTHLHSVGEQEFVQKVEAELDEFPAGRSQCIHVVLEAFRSALADHRSFLIEEFRGEKPLICTCFGVLEETIESYAAANAPVSVQDVTLACRAGGGCGSCRMLIQEIIDSHN